MSHTVRMFELLRRRSFRTMFLMMVLACTMLMLLAYQSMSFDQRNMKVVRLKDFGDGSIFNHHLESRARLDIQRVLLETTSDIPSVTATRKPPSLELDDIYISVKTTKKYHKKRLDVIVKTWFQLAKNQIWFFTDTDNMEDLQQETGGHMINTYCNPSHSLADLRCKTSVEFDTYLESEKKWWCHFDDDNYVNIPKLVELLKDYDPINDWYLGKLSINRPVTHFYKDYSVNFWFATGGAGFCISRALALRMSPIAGEGKFKSIFKSLYLPDDVALGYLIHALLKVPVTVVERLHSHLESMKDIKNYKDQISFSYGLPVQGFDNATDPTRFLSLHCYLFPHFENCESNMD